MTAAPALPPHSLHLPRSRARVAAFVARHLTGAGTLRLHRAALGLDLLRAPANVALAPVLLACRGGARLAGALRLPRVSAWAAARPVLLRTRVSAQIEAALLRDLFEAPLPETDRSPSRAALTAALFAAPELRGPLAQHPDGGKAAAQRVMAVLTDYTGTRAAVAELTTALVTIALGAVLFQALTPGMFSMAPGLAGAVSREAAVAGFPLGETLGGLWYGLFPTAPGPWLTGLTLAGLISVSGVVTAFAGCLADPVQARLGLHRRRLLRLIDTVEAELSGAQDRPFATREHYLVRVFDLWDAALSLLRAFRT